MDKADMTGGVGEWSPMAREVLEQSQRGAAGTLGQGDMFGCGGGGGIGVAVVEWGNHPTRRKRGRCSCARNIQTQTDSRC